jgi:hypothetical protein
MFSFGGMKIRAVCFSLRAQLCLSSMAILAMLLLRYWLMLDRQEILMSHLGGAFLTPRKTPGLVLFRSIQNH